MLISKRRALKFVKKQPPFIKFSMVGFAVSILDLGLFVLMIFLGIHYLLAFSVSFTIGTVLKYIYEKGFVFDNKTNHIAKQFTLFEVFSVADFLINMLLIFIFVDWLFFEPIIARIITSLITFLIIYCAHKNITFSSRFFN
jgi:putative flippase GtrA